MSRTELATKMGVVVNLLEKMEAGTISVPSERLAIAAWALGCGVDTLLRIGEKEREA